MITEGPISFKHLKMPSLKSLTTPLIIGWLCLVTSTLAMSCTKEIIHKYPISKVDPFSHRLVNEITSKKVIVIMCCEGYRELEPIRQFRYQQRKPNCEPVCNTPCGHGVCSSPNNCVCDVGYERSDLGSCVASTEKAKGTPTTIRSKTTQPAYTFRSSPPTTPIVSYFSRLSSSILEKLQGPLCTKEIIHTDKALKFDPYTHRLVNEVKSKKAIVIICCAGYRELEPVRTLSNQQRRPNCEPICTTPCSHGVCSSPDHCVCDVGYQRSDLGSCVATQEKREENLDPIQLKSSTIKSSLDFEAQSSTHLTTISVEPVLFKARSTSLVPRPKEVEGQTTVAERPPKKDRTGMVFQKSSTVSQKLRTTTFEPQLAVTVAISCVKCHQGECISGACICPQGFNQTDPGLCQPICEQSCRNGHCSAPNHCECVNGYTYDSESNQCKPLCNGKIYGCIRGACVGYNQCRCDKGLVLRKDELFHCEEAVKIESIHAFDWRPYLWLLLIPAAIVCVSFYIVLRRWKAVKANRLEAQSESFSEVRYYNPQNGHSLTDGQDSQQASGKRRLLRTDSLEDQDTFRYNGNVVVIRA